MMSAVSYIARNLGPKTTAELSSAGVTSLTQLKRLGWEKVMLKLIAKFPDRLNMNMIAAVIVACSEAMGFIMMKSFLD
jgi:hypothetical protein